MVLELGCVQGLRDHNVFHRMMMFLLTAAGTEAAAAVMAAAGAAASCQAVVGSALASCPQQWQQLLQK